MSWIDLILNKSKRFARVKRKQQQFCWLIAGVMIVWFGYVYLYRNQTDFLIVPSLIFVLITLLSFTSPRFIYLLLFIWYLLGQIMSEIISTLMLGIVYFGFFFPITYIMRIFRKKRDKSGWVEYIQPNSDYRKMY